MAACYLNNIYLLFLPAHTSHGLQPWDNGPFGVLKVAYRRFLSQLSALNDSSNGGKIQFMNCLIEARKSLTPTVIKGGWKHTGNWPISRNKALRHPEIQQDKEKRKAAEMEGEAEDSGDESEAITHDFITKLGRGGDYEQRRKLRKIANVTQDLQAENIILKQEIASLKALIKEFNKGKKRRVIPNPNARFQKICEIIAAGGNPNEVPEVVEGSNSEDSDSGEDSGGGEEVGEEAAEAVPAAESSPVPVARPTRSGRQAQKPTKYR